MDPPNELAAPLQVIHSRLFAWFSGQLNFSGPGPFRVARRSFQLLVVQLDFFQEHRPARIAVAALEKWIRLAPVESGIALPVGALEPGEARGCALLGRIRSSGLQQGGGQCSTRGPDG